LIFIDGLAAFTEFESRLRAAVSKLRRRGWDLREEHFEGLLWQAKGVVERVVEAMEGAGRAARDP
jgi:hypothetical protein